MSKKYYIVCGVVLFIMLVILAMLFAAAKNAPAPSDDQTSQNY